MDTVGQRLVLRHPLLPREQKEGAWELLKFMCSQHAREIIGEK